MKLVSQVLFMIQLYTGRWLLIIKLDRQLPRIEFAYQVAKTLSTDIESLYMPLSLNLFHAYFA